MSNLVKALIAVSVVVVVCGAVLLFLKQRNGHTLMSKNSHILNL